MLSLNQSNRVTFSVNVFGTAALPSVRCVVGAEPAMSFNAVRTADGQYETVINLPTTMEKGSYPFSIEVMLNGKIFTPISTTIAVVPHVDSAGNEVSAPAVPIPPLTPKVQTPWAPEPEPAPKIAPQPPAGTPPVQVMQPEPVKPSKVDAPKPKEPLLPKLDTLNPKADGPAPPKPTISPAAKVNTAVPAIGDKPVKSAPPEIKFNDRAALTPPLKDLPVKAGYGNMAPLKQAPAPASPAGGVKPAKPEQAPKGSKIETNPLEKGALPREIGFNNRAKLTPGGRVDAEIRPRQQLPETKPMQLSKLSSVKTPPLKPRKPAVTEAPAAPIKISMLDVANSTATRESAPPTASGPKMTFESRTPVTFTRGEVVYL